MPPRVIKEQHFDAFRRCKLRYRLVHVDGRPDAPDGLDAFEIRMRQALAALWIARARAAEAEGAGPPGSGRLVMRAWERSHADRSQIEDLAHMEAATAVAAYERIWRADGAPVAAALPYEAPVAYPAGAQAAAVLSGAIDAIMRLPGGEMAVLVHAIAAPGDTIGDDSPIWNRLVVEGRIARAFIAADAAGFRLQDAVVDAVSRPRGTKTPPRFARRMFERDEAAIERAVADMAEAAAEMADADTLGRWPRAVGGCEPEPGRRCAFLRSCLGLSDALVPLIAEADLRR